MFVDSGPHCDGNIGHRMRERGEHVDVGLESTSINDGSFSFDLNLSEQSGVEACMNGELVATDHSIAEKF